MYDRKPKLRRFHYIYRYHIKRLTSAKDIDERTRISSCILVNYVYILLFDLFITGNDGKPIRVNESYVI